MSSRKKVIVVKLHPGQKAIVVCEKHRRRKNRNLQNNLGNQNNQNPDSFC